MRLPFHSRLFRIAGLVLGVLAWLANASNPPTGNTGAPFDGSCNNCHSGGSYSGTVVVDGLPGTIEPNTTYPLTITLTATGGSPVRAGYQLVVVDGNNANAGDLITVNGQSGTEFFSSREYIEHRGAKVFSGGSVQWAFNWKSPVSASGNTIKLFFIGNFTNGNGLTSGDNAIEATDTYSFSGLPPVTATMSSVTPVSCFGGNNGSATVEADGGAPPYSYLWSNGQNGQTAINLTAGTYTVTATGSGGSGTATATAVITQPPAITANVTVQGVLTCINTSVTATANVSGGTGPYTFEWSSGQTGNPVQLTTPGNHVVSVTDSNGCLKVAQATVLSNTTAPNVQAGPTATLTCAQPTAVLNGAGTSTGPTFTYLWTASNGGNIVSGATTLTPLVNAAGTYTLVVTNSTNGCTAEDFTTASSSINPPTASATGGVLTCTATSVTLTSTTNAGSPTFAWSGPNGFTSTQQNPSANTAGTYTVVVTNTANGCTKTATASVTQNVTPPSASATAETLTCADTMAQITTTTNANPGTFAWSGPNGFTSSMQNPNALIAGTYTVIVTSGANGCTNTATVAVAQNTTPPTASATAETITCADTMAQITTTTNANPATFAWTGPNGFTSTTQNPNVPVAGTYTVVVTNGPNGCTNTATVVVPLNTTPPTASATAETITCVDPLAQITTTTNANPATFAWTGPNGFTSTVQNPNVSASGTYTVTIGNGGNGCTNTATVVVPLNTTPPTASATAETITCVDPLAQITTTTNANPATFAWSGPNGFTSTVQNPNVSASGTYTVTIGNGGNGCTNTATVVVPLNTTPPTADIAAPINLNCSVTEIQLNGTPSSQGPNFDYQWTTTDGNIISGDTTLTPTVNEAGTYVLLVTNTTNGCTSTDAVAVVQSPPVSATIGNVDHVNCNGEQDGSATATGSGGSGTFTYVWSNGDNTATADNLAAGTYFVSVTDGENCTATASVTINQPLVLNANATSTGETGSGSNDGTATASPSGGTPGYLYLWSTTETTATITGLAPGNYTVSVTDAAGCTAIQVVTVNSFNCSISASATTTNVTCFGASNGTATAVLTGAAFPATYLWSNGDTTATADNLAPGTYTAEIEDANGCPAELTVQITGPTVLAANASATNETGVGQNNGTATAQPTGGTGPYTYQWSNNATTQTITGLAPGQYTVVVSDDNDCTAVQTVTVSAFGCNLAATISSVNVLCNGDKTGQATAIPSGGSAPINYLWSNGATTATTSGLAAGTYTVVVSDAAGCQTTSTATISQPTPIEVQAAVTPASCPQAKDGSATISISGGTGPYTFSWPGGGGGQGLGVGTYTVTYTDANGCTVLKTIVVTSNDTIAPSVTCPPSVTACAGIPAQYTPAVAADNCGANNTQVELISGLPSGSSFPVGTTVQVFRAKDASGNSATCSFAIEVGPPVEIKLDTSINDVGNAGLGSIAVTVSGGVGNRMFLWTKDGQPFADIEDLNGLTKGVYVLTVIDQNGCTRTLAPVLIDNTTSISEPASDAWLRVIPNPASQFIWLDMHGLQPVSAQILDATGRLLRTLTAGEWQGQIEVANLPSGLHHLLVQDQNGRSYMAKWVKTE
ncbi:MAG: choice-of-anchor V domain-containing protein [Saprospiraceae bacterium]